MIEMRWIYKSEPVIEEVEIGAPVSRAIKVLQYRQSSGDVLKNQKLIWSDWIDVPIVADPT